MVGDISRIPAVKNETSGYWNMHSSEVQYEFAVYKYPCIVVALKHKTKAVGISEISAQMHCERIIVRRRVKKNAIPAYRSLLAEPHVVKRQERAALILILPL